LIEVNSRIKVFITSLILVEISFFFFFFFSSRRRHTRFKCDWSSDVCSSDLRRPVRRLYPRPFGPIRPRFDVSFLRTLCPRSEVSQISAASRSLLRRLPEEGGQRLSRAQARLPPPPSPRSGGLQPGLSSAPRLASCSREPSQAR